MNFTSVNCLWQYEGHASLLVSYILPNFINIVDAFVYPFHFECLLFPTPICSSPLQLQTLLLWNVSAFSTPLKQTYIVSCCHKFKLVNFVQWFSMRRQHALIVIADSLYYSKFRDYCKVNSILKCSLIYCNLFCFGFTRTLFDSLIRELAHFYLFQF